MSNMNIFKRLSLVPAGLRYKLLVAFCLMSIIPLMVCVYIVSNFVFPYIKAIGSLSVVIGVTIFITFLGFMLAKQMIEPIIDMAIKAKLIANGDLESPILVDREDEIGDLGASLNIMTQRIKENLEELKAYGEKTSLINAEIHKKVIALSGLLHVGDLISIGTDLKTTLDMLVEKLSMVNENNPAAVMVMDKDNNLVPIAAINYGQAEAWSMPTTSKHGVFANLRTGLRDIVIDKSTSIEDKNINSFKQLYGIKNSVISPIIVRGRFEGTIVIGNNLDNFEYKAEDIELLHVFCKQTAIAIENDMLIKKTEELEIKDDLTGLYNNKYIREHLEEEIKRAIIYQRPCSFILFNIDDFKDFCDKKSRVAGEAALKKIARLISQELTPVDKGARFSDSEFALVLPERNKKEAERIADEVRRKIAELTLLSERDEIYKHLTASGGVAENPIDGISAKELIDKACERLKEAKTTGKNTIKV